MDIFILSNYKDKINYDLLGQLSSFEFFFYGGFLLRKNQPFQGYAIASFLRSASELASPALTILATVCKSNTRN